MNKAHQQKMAATALLSIFEATSDLNTALDECLLASEDQIKTDLVSRVESELKALLEQERAQLSRKPPQDLVDQQLALISRLREIGDSAAEVEKEAQDRLGKWQPKIDELDTKEKELADLNRLLLVGKRFVRAKALAETLNKASSTWETRIEALLELLRIFNTGSNGTRFSNWLKSKVESFAPKARTELESEISKSLKTIKWPIADDKFDSPAASSLCRAIASLVQLQISLGWSRSGFMREDESASRLVEIHANEVVSELWGLQQLSRPSIVRFQFHFASERSTNRIDRPEWFVAFILQCVRDTAPFIERRLQPSLAKLRWREASAPDAENQAEAGNGQDEGNVFYVDALSQFIRGLVKTAHGRLETVWAAMEDNDSLVSHTMDELLIGDRNLGGEFGYGSTPQFWPTLSSFFYLNDARINVWLRADLRFAKERLGEIVQSKTAWQSLSSVVSATGPGSVLDDKDFATECSDAAMAMIDALGSRIDLCASDDDASKKIRTRFVEDVQCALIKDMALHVLKRFNLAERLNTFRPMHESLLDWKLKSRYMGITRSANRQVGKTLLFGAAARMIAKRASSSAAESNPSTSRDHSLTTTSDQEDSAEEQEWVFQPYVTYLQRLLREEIDTETSRVFELVTTTWKEWERKAWNVGLIDIPAANESAVMQTEVSQEFCEGLSIAKKQTESWRTLVNPIDRVGLATGLAKSLDDYLLDFANRKMFSGSGALQLERDLIALTELFRPFSMVQGSKRPLRDRFFPRFSAMLRVLSSPLDELRRLRDTDVVGSFSVETSTSTSDLDVRTVASRRVGI